MTNIIQELGSAQGVRLFRLEQEVKKFTTFLSFIVLPCIGWFGLLLLLVVVDAQRRVLRR